MTLSTARPGRYHLILAFDGRSVMHGWWDREATARDQFRQLVGEQGRPGAHITLTDEETGDQVDDWPGIVSGQG